MTHPSSPTTDGAAPAGDAQHLQRLRARFDAGEAMKFMFFWRHTPHEGDITAACLSQWCDAPFEVHGQRYATAEHFMMAEKASLFGDRATRARILVAPDPATAKALGRQVAGYDEATWLRHRFSVVSRASEARFAQNAALGAFLDQTGSHVLAEASPMDAVWGIGLGAEHPLATDPREWRGLNLLGFALMQVRDARNARAATT
jgi:ribA/ribD-fused uncharacterized protein